MMDLPPIILDNSLYGSLRETGLAPPDELVLASINRPNQVDCIYNRAAERVDLSLLRTAVAGRDILVVTILKSDAAARTVWLSILMPRYLEAPTPILTLELFAMRFGVIFSIAGKLYQFAKGVSIARVPDGTTSLVEGIEDNSCSFIVFSPYISEGERILLPIAFGIDLDHYARWRQTCLPTALEGTCIEINPELRSKIKIPAILDARANILLALNVGDQPLADLNLRMFTVVANDFTFSAGIESGHLYLRRNSDRAAASLPSHHKGDEVALVLSWTPEMISVSTGSKIERNPFVHRGSVTTAPTFPPRSLVGWARQERMRPVFLYEKSSHVHGTVLDLLVGVQDKIAFTSMQSAFWNRTGDASFAPKREVDVHKIVEALLFDGCTAKNLQCYAEPRVEGGNIDFLITGMLVNGSHVSVCVEFKNAHASDLHHGIDVQLPVYMDSRASDCGIYCILYYRCDKFDRPNKNPDDLGAELEARRFATGRNVTILVWDLGFRDPPSKR